MLQFLWQLTLNCQSPMDQEEWGEMKMVPYANIIGGLMFDVYDDMH